MIQVWEEVSKQVLGQNANVPFHMIVQHKSCSYGRFVLPAPSLALPVGWVGRWHGGQGGHSHGRYARESFARSELLR